MMHMLHKTQTQIHESPDSSQNLQIEKGGNLTGQRCTFFVLKHISSTAPRGEKTDSSSENPKKGEKGKREGGPVDEFRTLAVEDGEERPRDHDRSREVAIGSRERIRRSSNLEEEP